MPDETKLAIKRERFIRLAEARTNKIIKTIQLLSNCSNRASYLYYESDIEQIFTAIEDELEQTRNKFNRMHAEKGSRFYLRDPETGEPLMGEEEDDEEEDEEEDDE